MDIVGSRDRSGQELVQRGGFGCAGPGCSAARMRRAFAGELRREVLALHRGDGSLLRRASSGPRVRGQGHEVRLMSPEYVRPYVKAQKNDDLDAEAIAEAATPADDAVR